jgi:hypothetical protein
MDAGSALTAKVVQQLADLESNQACRSRKVALLTLIVARSLWRSI